ncbi:N-acetyl-gamma-glutamyl-phosphate reductase [Candidatus Binatia bacterium]|nr:N-acetyl-gamma-glutamyl-phosphate reductase [Candidatus Binatia bacterium]
MKPRVYIDGQAGTTGLQIRERLGARDDITLLEIDEARRKDPAAREELLRAADVAILCLPDDAAREAVALAADSSVRFLDASTAHRVAEGWTYGLAELEPGQRAAIRAAKHVANPGCYPTGVVLLLRPLVDAGLVRADTPIAVHALSGYSGGGRQMIERWEDPATGLASLPFEAPYALDREHKHVPEMTRYARLAHKPQFVPAVGPFRCGMRIEIPLHAALLPAGTNAARLHAALLERYAGEPFVAVRPFDASAPSDERAFDPQAMNGTNRIELAVLPNPLGHVLLLATLDNLGKGAAGAAVQNLNLMLGLDEAHGLTA